MTVGVPSYLYVPDRTDRSSHPTVPLLRIRLLGGFRVERLGDGALAHRWQRSTAKTLTKLLATYPGHALHREQVLELLWPGVDLDSALNSFGKALHAARRAVEPELPRRKGSSYLLLSDSMVALNAEHVVVDADEFEELAEDALRSKDLSGYRAALAAYHGELLPENRYEDWCADRREVLAELRVRLLLGLADALESDGAYRESADRLREALERDPTREEAHRRLMRLYAHMGTSDLAVRQFHACQEALRRELDLAPQPETVTLYNDLLADRIRQPSAPESSRETIEAPVLPPAEPSGVAPFVGRNGVADRMREALWRENRDRPAMVLVTGEAGVGKTRLLEEVARQAGREGAEVLWAGTGAHAHRFACGPFAVALERYAASRPEHEREELANRYPALCRLVPSLRRNGQVPTAMLDAPGDHLDAIPATVRLLTDLGAARPVLLMLGDLHDLDSLSLDLLRYLTHLAVPRAWLLVAAVREDEVEAGSELWELIDRTTHEGLCLKFELPCLSREECDQVVRTSLSDACVSDEVLKQIYLRSRGNPLFVEELVHEVHGRENVTRRGAPHRGSALPNGRVPARVRALAATRLAHLDQTARRVLELATVASRAVISLDDLQAGAASLEPPVPRPALLDAIDCALDAGLLEERAGGYAFRYPLVRCALYEGLSSHRREQFRAALTGTPPERYPRLSVSSAS